MKPSKEWFVRGTYILLAIVAVTDVALFASVTAARYSIRVSKVFSRSSLAEGAGLSPGGYSASGNKVSVSTAREKGWAVRYASSKCEYCRADEARWSNLKLQLLNKGYRIVEIPPDLSESFSDGAPELTGETQIPFVDVDWMKRYRLTMTPTTLLFNGHGKVIWTQDGVMSEADQKSAAQAAFWNR